MVKMVNVMLCVFDCNFKPYKNNNDDEMTHFLPSLNSQQTQGSLLNADVWPRRTQIPVTAPDQDSFAANLFQKVRTPR